MVTGNSHITPAITILFGSSENHFYVKHPHLKQKTKKGVIKHAVDGYTLEWTPHTLTTK